ncbi:MAG: alpha-ketoglutarate-dependent dioxygenase AlkB [Mongoliibacter sp.]|uniref:alpha-ketoglutarate-dependent dioxygenase AlkB family protein n=1 Tax=Mongoliibacter sp. TaxID=2022438 RepID=UPI0012F4345C|nr:alpha-ketoglutarate-dependent dioxygenase AlkB [Mongoliibacter sp.]TVP51077.1 MAG: alpha-ketoglutarate-dependent dioxygenase AlkB [Mongoliibacter sp.]
MLFDLPADRNLNLLPMDGSVLYFGKIFSTIEADHFFKMMYEKIEWKKDEAMIFGKKIYTKRKVAWYADFPFEYTYSNVTKSALPWTDELLEIKKITENVSGERFNSCLLNLYHSGSEGMAWHSDGERDLKKNGAIGSVSFGAERKFSFKHKNSGQKIDLLLEHGSLLIMKGETQTHWMHRLPPTKKVFSPRVNLTFRTIDKEQ